MPRPIKPRRGGWRKQGLRTFQMRALKVLSDPRFVMGLNLTDLSKKANVSANVLWRGLGPTEAGLRKKHDERLGYKCLASLGHVRVLPDCDGGTVYVVTALGLKAAAKLPSKLPRKHGAPWSRNGTIRRPPHQLVGG